MLSYQLLCSFIYVHPHSDCILAVFLCYRIANPLCAWIIKIEQDLNRYFCMQYNLFEKYAGNIHSEGHTTESEM